MQIRSITAYQVYDSRGNPTLEAVVTLDHGIEGAAMVPSGASTGSREALELRDKDAGRFMGRSVFRAIENVNGQINPALRGCDVADQAALDRLLIELDGTPNKSRLGANAILGVSMAAARAAANSLGLPLHAHLGEGALLPLPEIQIFGGGAHSAGRIDVQDFMIVCVGAHSYHECLEMTFNVYHQAGRCMKKRGKLAGLADEGGYWPMFDSNEEVFEVLMEAIHLTGYRPGLDIAISLDIAATELHRDGRYRFGLEGQSFTSEEFAAVLSGWCDKYPIVSIEDPFAEDDRAAWSRFTAQMGDRLQIVGDDLFTTNERLIEEGIRDNLANSVLIKLNQIGTVTETLRAIRTARDAGWTAIVSARSGETEDPFIAHLAVAADAGQLKVGSFARSERMVKWNEILRIERQLGGRARFAGGLGLETG